ncbi:HAD family hydrolase [Planctomicrobium sp. SH664]|uniref:HAD family hydrolase n=1 Tax=Planctomicrobium sp. SH664 TaxID=3448125 RepID=UPI003F5BF5A7
MTELPRIEAVVFDLDGLMFNTEDVFHLTGTELMRRRGKLATPELFHKMMGRRAHEAFQAMIDHMELADTIELLTVESSEIFDGLLDHHLAPMPGLFELLQHIEDHQLPKAVATSSDRDYATKILDRYGLLPRFQALLTAEDVSHGKPHPEIYLKAAQRLEVDPSRMLVLEDSENGTRAAAAAGAHIISVPHDHSRHHDFSVAKGVAQSLGDPRIRELIRR